VKQAYPEAVQSVSVDRTPNNARNHRPVRVLVPLWEFNHSFSDRPFCRQTVGARTSRFCRR
jgi:hypothetical protein